MNTHKILWFTLVELIVVITIVWILSTVWFVSYSGYLTGARDSNRFSQLTKLSDSLQTYAASKSLPLPDDYIEITASGSSNVIAYQWYVWVDVLETIDYTNGGKDPKDDSYFTYYLTKDRKSLQLLALMEDSSSVSLQNNKIFAADYSERFPKVYGQKLGVLVSWEDTNLNTPAQEISENVSSGYLDIFNTNNIYEANFGQNGTVIWTWSILWIQQLWGWWLIWYWGFNEWYWNTVYDTSWRWNNGTLTGATTPTYISWVKGTALNFSADSDSLNWWFVDIWNIDVETPFYTYSFWIKPSTDINLQTNNSIIKTFTEITPQTNNYNFEFNWNHVKVEPQSFWASGTRLNIEGLIDTSKWNHITCVLWKDILKIYVNGELNNTMKTDWITVSWGTYVYFWAWSWTQHLGTRWMYSWWLDEVYIFKHLLNDQEIKLLYQNSQ